MIEFKKRLRISHFVLAICMAGPVVTYPYDLWLRYQDERKLTPVLTLNTIVRGLKAHYDQHRSFPKAFTELDSKIWRHPRIYYTDGSEMEMANYYYSYYLVRSDFCTIWAFAGDQHNEKADTIYLELTPDGYQIWKRRKPFTIEEKKTAPPVPNREYLGSKGMAEDKYKEFKNKDKKRRSK